ncbi:Ubiquitin specific proteinase [Oopsacas minuta]|uniref:Ubiquitin specific proteinase n=1 Tax=Oopsacas minuta TaxID=111878 RepID=A0AAV7JQG2_9METZ|nr:Ubiquitin specific proteinase [Oopsacas minuta]
MAVADNEATTHGLSNFSGENNCFINSVIQVLWHLNIFRSHFGQLQEHVCYEQECVFCTLKELFVNFQYSESITLPPNFVRKAMAKCYKDTGRFQLSKMDYAVECYEAVLRQLHTQITGTDWATTCTHAKCLPHKIFSYSSCQIDVCECGATSEPFPSEDILFYISADNLLKVMKKSHTSHKEILRDGNAFGKVLKECLTTDKQHKCPDSSDCKKSAKVETMLLRSPYTINLSLSWSSEISTKERVVDVLKSVGHCINIKQMFSVSLDETAGNKEYFLLGIINYYGHHFSAFVYNTNLSKWIFCDDASFREVGNNWDDVIQLIKRAKYQPELLVYSTRDVDIWKEEGKRKPLPQIPPKPNIAHYISNLSIPNDANTTISPANLPTSSNIRGVYSQVPLIPQHIINNTSIQMHATVPTSSTQVTSSPQLPPVVPSAPPPPSPPAPKQYDKDNRTIFYPPNYNKQKAAESRKTSQTPNKNNPVVLVKMEKKQEVPAIFTLPQPPTNANTNNANHEDLLLDYVRVSSSCLSEFDATHIDRADAIFAPNLLLDIDNKVERNRKAPTSPIIPKEDKKMKQEDDLIDFTFIPAIDPEDVYNELFQGSDNKHPSTTLNIK